MEWFFMHMILQYSNKDTRNIQQALISNMDQINAWLRLNRLSLNTAKTKTMLFGSVQKLAKTQQTQLDIVINNTTLEQTSWIKYLGVYIDSHLKWVDHINHTSSKISKQIGVLNRIKHFLPTDTLNLLVKSLIFPHLDYCSLIWSNAATSQLSLLDRLLNRAGRVILRAPSRTQTCTVYERLGWEKLERRRLNQLNVMMFKCLNGLAPPYLCSIITRVSAYHSHSTRSHTAGNVVLPLPRSEAGRRTLKFRGSQAWNKLPSQLKAHSSVNLGCFINQLHLL